MTRYKQYENGSVPISKINFENRGDIVFRIYYIMTGDIGSMKKWKHNVKHGKKRSSYNARYTHKWFEAIKNTKTNVKKFGWSTIKKRQGRILSPVPFAYDKKTGFYYPAGGQTRIPAAYVLGHAEIPALIFPVSRGQIWKKNFGVGSKHFVGMPDEILKILVFRQEIDIRFKNSQIKRKVRRGDFLYEIPELGFRGKYSADNLIQDKEFVSKISGKKLANLTLDNGWLDIKCASFCKEIFSSGLSVFYKIASKIRDYYGVKNLHCFKRVPLDINYDLIMVNNVILDDKIKRIVSERKKVYEKDNLVLFSS